MNSSQYAAVSTCINNTKYLPTFYNKLCARDDVEMYCSNRSLLAVKWKDTKEVIVATVTNQKLEWLKEKIKMDLKLK